jgi:hypothetical protein
MILSINQPAYLPWLGYCQRIAISDVHVILDHVQFEKNSFTNRNKIRTKDGSLMLTIPLKTKGLFGQLAINSIEIADDTWRLKHLKTLKGTYSKSPFFKTYEAQLLPFFEQKQTQFIDSILPMNEWLLKQLGIETKLVKSSDIKPEGTKSDLVLNICKELGASTYLSGPIGRDYLDMKSFKDANIEVEFHDYKHPNYKQMYEPFLPYMTVLDLLFNYGPESLTYLNQGNENTI